MLDNKLNVVTYWSLRHELRTRPRQYTQGLDTFFGSHGEYEFGHPIIPITAPAGCGCKLYKVPENVSKEVNPSSHSYFIKYRADLQQQDSNS